MRHWSSFRCMSWHGLCLRNHNRIRLHNQIVVICSHVLCIVPVCSTEDVDDKYVQNESVHSTHSHSLKHPVLNLNTCPSVSVLHNTGYRSAAAICEWALVMCFFMLFAIFSAEFRYIDFHELHVQNNGFRKSSLDFPTRQSNTVAPTGHLTNIDTPAAKWEFDLH